MGPATKTSRPTSQGLMKRYPATASRRAIELDHHFSLRRAARSTLALAMCPSPATAGSVCGPRCGGRGYVACPGPRRASALAIALVEDLLHLLVHLVTGGLGRELVVHDLIVDLAGQGQRLRGAGTDQHPL